MSAALPAALALGWGLWVVGLARRRRRRLVPPERLAGLAAATHPGPSFAPHDRRSRRAQRRGPLAAATRLATPLGATVRRALGLPADDDAAGRWGLVLVAAGLGLLAGPGAAGTAAMTVAAAQWLARRRGEQRRRQAVARALPDVVDLFALAASAGLTVHLALRAVAARARGPVGDALRATVIDVELGGRAADALEELPARLGPEVRPLAAALVACERHGAPLGEPLDRLAAELRRERRRAEEERIRKVPVKLLFPLVCCTLPAFALLTVVPLLAATLRSLRL